MRVSVEKDRHVDRSSDARLGVLLLVVLAALASSDSVAAQEQPAASFGAAAQDERPGAAGDPPSGDNAEPAEPTLSFSFRFAPWEEVLVKFADVAGLTLDLTDVPSGTFNYHDKGRYSPREALDILNGYLLQRGYVLVRRDRFLVCVNLEKGVPPNLIPLVTVDALADLGANELASVLLASESLDAKLAASQIEPLQGSHGKVVVLPATNSLLVTDTGGNLRLYRRLLTEGAFQRRAGSGGGPAFKAFALQHVRADEAERLIRQLFGLPASTFPSSATPPRGPGLADLKITTDARSNRLFVAATSAQLASIEQLVEAYDVAGGAADGAPRAGPTTTRILPLPNADVIIIGRALESLSPRIRVSTTRSVRRPSSQGAVESPAAKKPDAEPAAGARPSAAAPQRPEGRDR